MSRSRNIRVEVTSRRLSQPRQPASTRLPVLAGAFLHTFVADPKPVRPLKRHLHRDLNAWRQAQPRPAAIGLIPRRRFLHGYTQRTAYLKALAREESRIDLTGAIVDDDRPESIREQARQEIARRQALRSGTAGRRKAAPANPAAAWLPRLAAAFPQTFFADPRQVRPLKVFLYRDLLRQDLTVAWPAGIDRAALKAFLRWYGQRTAYLNAVARGLGRIDLTGAVVTMMIPEDLRKSARVEVQRRQAHRAAQATTTTVASSPLAPTPAPVPMPYTLEDLYAMAIDAKLELTLKFTTLPNARPSGPGKMAFALKTPDGQFVTAEVGTKAWNKLVKAAEEWPAWTAALSGTMGKRTEKGFTLAGPGLQVFEKKAKTAEATPPPVDTTPVPAPPAEPVAPPQPAAPITVTTGAGTATVTKRSSLSLKRNASTSSKPDK